MCRNDGIRQAPRNQKKLIPAYTSEAPLLILIFGTSIAFTMLVLSRNFHENAKAQNNIREGHEGDGSTNQN